MKIKNVNAYIDEKGKKFVVIKTESGETLFINEGLLAYACQHAKPVKPKTCDNK